MPWSVGHRVSILAVHFDDTVVTTTAEHPFWVTDAGWTEAGELEPGMRLLTASGETATIEKVEFLDRTATVYNIEVAGHHTYFVSDEEVLVHNAACGWNPKRTLNDPLPRAANGDYISDPGAMGPHSVLGTRVSSTRGVGAYRQGATFGNGGRFLGRADVTNHGRPWDHPYSPHFHPASSPNGVLRGGPILSPEQMGI